MRALFTTLSSFLGFSQMHSQLGKNVLPSLFFIIYDTFYPIKKITGKFQYLFRMPFFQK